MRFSAHSHSPLRLSLINYIEAKAIYSNGVSSGVQVILSWSTLAIDQPDLGFMCKKEKFSPTAERYKAADTALAGTARIFNGRSGIP